MRSNRGLIPGHKVVRVVRGPWAGLEGHAVRLVGGVLRVRIGGDKCALVDPAHVVEVVEEKPTEGRDFSESGLGIGGLATYEEPVIVPTMPQLAALERLAAAEIICKRCGASSLDGAMFTTLGGEPICDDCV